MATLAVAAIICLSACYDNMVPTDTFHPYCDSSSIGDNIFCQTDNRQLTFHRQAGFTSAEYQHMSDTLYGSYDSLGTVAEEAAAGGRGGFEARWLHLTRAIRGWALANPNEYALIYGSPVPGYQAPRDTIVAATRTVAAAASLVVAGVASGEIDVEQTLPIPRPVRADLVAVREALAPGVPDSVLSRTLYAWAQLFGSLTFELFGQYENVIHDRDEFFDHQMRRTAHLLRTGG